MRVLITGSSGFIGRQLVRDLQNEIPSILIRAAVRKTLNEGNRPKVGQAEAVAIGEIDAFTNWGKALNQVDVVIHLAARVHIMSDSSADPLEEYRKINVAATINLARQAAEAGVKRFIFLSSIKVNGELTPSGDVFSEISPLLPEDPYGISKMEAEESLRSLCREKGMEFVIIRVPLVYGPGVKANFQKLMLLTYKASSYGLPLPLGGIKNKRSMLALGNLIDFLYLAILHPKASNEIFLLCDGSDLSTSELLVKLAISMHQSLFLFPLPDIFLQFIGILMGNKKSILRLTASLRIDASKARNLLAWYPPIKIDDAIASTTRAFLKEKN